MVRKAFLIPVFLAAAVAQTRPAFEVVSIKPAAASSHTNCGKLAPGCRTGAEWTATADVAAVIRSAYDLGYVQLVNAPEWTESTAFVFTAKVGPDVPLATFREMQQKMLIERFHLASHAETRQVATFGLRVAASGSHLVASSGPCIHTGALNTGERPSGLAPCGREGLVGYTDDKKGMRIALRDITLPDFLSYLHDHYDNLQGPPYVDLTGLNGRFDIAFTLPLPPPLGGTQSVGGRTVVTAEEGQDAKSMQRGRIQEALREQLGLDINFAKAEKLPVRVLVVDSITLPTPD